MATGSNEDRQRPAKSTLFRRWIQNQFSVIVSGLIATVVGGVIVAVVDPADPTPDPPPEHNQSRRDEGPLTNLGIASIQVRRPAGQDCNGIDYDVTVTVQNSPAEDRTLWLVVILHANAAAGWDHALYFAKEPIDTRPGVYNSPLHLASRVPGNRRTFLVVSADPAAHKELDRNYQAGRRSDDTYPNDPLFHLPFGALEIARSPDIEQQC
jgi:hypothetical protein